MWVVYLIDTSGFDWGHKYFNHEENARKHFEDAGRNSYVFFTLYK